MIFDSKSFVESPKAQNFEWLLKIARMTYEERLLLIPSVEGEVQAILDYIVKMKKVEDKYLTKLGFVGKGSDAFRTLPEFGGASRDTAPMHLGTLDFMENTQLGSTNLKRYGDQDINLATSDTLLTIRNEDRVLRRLNYKILKARLMANQKLELLKKLKAEKAHVEGSSKTVA
jgi:hypothetical protein